MIKKIGITLAILAALIAATAAGAGEAIANIPLIFFGGSMFYAAIKAFKL